MPQVSTPPGKVAIYSRSTGQRIERWSVDALELIATGDYTPDAPEGFVPPVEPVVEVAPVDPVPHVTAANILNAAESPTGAPLAVARPSTVSVAAPVQMPAGRTESPRAARQRGA